MANTPFEDLAIAVADRQVVVVAGAGVTISATSNAPTASWIGLLSDGVERISGLALAPTSKWVDRQMDILTEAANNEGDLEDLLSVAEQVAKRLGWPDGGNWTAWLRETIGGLYLKDSSLIQAIANLGVPIVTTNYDNLIEQVTGLDPITWMQGSRAVDMLRGADAGILHWHGHFRHPASVVLGIRDYQALLGADLAQHVQKVTATINSLLFIGCGGTLEDPNFATFREWLQRTLRTTGHLHFRLARNAEVKALRQEHPDEERIVAIGFGDRHEDLIPFLTRLAQSAAAHRDRATGKRATQPRSAGIDLVTYSERARRKWETVDLTALAKPGSVDEDWRPKLHDVFIPQNARRGRPRLALPKDYLKQQGVDDDLSQPTEKEAIERWEQAERAPVLDFLTRNDIPNAVILGDPGAGKSCLARYILLRQLERLPNPIPPDLTWRTHLSGYIPFLVELRDYIAERSRMGVGLLEFLGRTVEALGFGFTASQLNTQLECAKTIFILDGLDEIFDTEIRRHVADEIIGFLTAKKFVNLRILVTSRIAGFNARPFEDAGFGIVTLDDLTESQIRTFATGWYRLACADIQDADRCSSDLMSAIQSRPQLKAIAGNPLILTIMAIIAKHESLARSRVGLYEQALSALCWGIEFRRKGVRIAEFSPLKALSPQDRLELIRHVAWQMQEKSGLRANAISEEALTLALREFFGTLGFTRPEQSQAAQEIIAVLQERNWILTLRGPDLYGFVHRTFLEYLCADHLLRQFRADRPDLTVFYYRNIAPHIGDDSWLEVIRLLVGLLGRDNPETAGAMIAQLTQVPVTQKNIDTAMTVAKADSANKAHFDEKASRLTLAFECLAEQESRNIPKLFQQVRALVNIYYSDSNNRWQHSGLGDRLVSALESLRVPNEMRQALELRHLPNRSSSTTWPDDQCIALITAFWQTGPSGFAMLSNEADQNVRSTRNRVLAEQDWVERGRIDHDWKVAHACAALANLFSDRPETLDIFESNLVGPRGGAVEPHLLHGGAGNESILRELLVGFAHKLNDKVRTIAMLKDVAGNDRSLEVRIAALSSLCLMFDAQDHAEVKSGVRDIFLQYIGNLVGIRSYNLRQLAEFVTKCYSDCSEMADVVDAARRVAREFEQRERIRTPR